MPGHGTIVLPPNSGPPRLDGGAYTNNELEATVKSTFRAACVIFIGAGYLHAESHTITSQAVSWLVT
jgi:hypothetical protein